MKKLDLTGQKFNKLLAIEKTTILVEGRKSWLCKCDCGNYTQASSRELKSGRKKSCGCIRKQILLERSRDFKELTLEYLQNILFYNSETGIWTWLKPNTPKLKHGDLAGYKNLNGYWVIGIGQKEYYAHRLAWFYMTGQWPNLLVEHKNRIKNDNRWENLRLATEVQNCANTGLRKNNKSGHKGVYWSKEKNKWCVQLKHNKKVFHLGYFNDITKASKAYNDKAFELFGEFVYKKEGD